MHLSFPARFVAPQTHVCSGLYYLHHERGIAHLDLKCENVLLGRTGEGQLVAKLADFDAAQRLGGRTSLVRGTADAHPPEYLVRVLCRSRGTRVNVAWCALWA